MITHKIVTGLTFPVGAIPTAGAGNGVYSGTLASVKSTVPVSVLAYDLAGTARPTTLDTAGAYVAP